VSREPRDYSGVAVAVPVSCDYMRSSRHDVPWFVGRALAALIKGAGITKADIDGLAIASYRLAPDNAASLCQYFGLSPRVLFDYPYGGAAGVIALRRAARAVQAGDAEIIACIAADVPLTGFGINANFSSAHRDHVYPYGAGGMTSIFALITKNYMDQHGATREDFGRVCIAQRANALGHPMAMFKSPLTMEQYLRGRPISDPICLFDCVSRCCGAEGYLVMSEDRARSLQIPFARIAGAVERHNGFSDEAVQSRIGIASDCETLYAQAGIGPDDLSFVQAYDDYPVIVMLQLEALGLCPRGEAVKFVREKALTFGGDLPLNTSGGMLNCGQASAAGGFLGLNDALRQLTDQQMGPNKIDGDFGIVSCYGTVHYDRGLCSTAAILARSDA
jgi:acetyl-CoA acetyltransferase